MLNDLFKRSCHLIQIVERTLKQMLKPKRACLAGKQFSLQWSVVLHVHLLFCFPGDFMTDMQQKMKQEEERLAKLDPWKVVYCCIESSCLLTLCDEGRK